MSSDESAKPHPAHKARNPFDISRRSEEEVAAEIAARLSAWKQARSRSVGSAPSSASRPPQTANTMVTPGVMSGTMNRASGSHAPTPHTYSPQRMPRFGEYAQERRTPEQQTADRDTREQATASAAIAKSMAASPAVAGPVVAPGALHRAVPAAPSPGRATRAFPFRANVQRSATPIPETPIPDSSIPETPIWENSAVESAAAQPIEIEPSAEIETPHVDSAPADAPAPDQIAAEPIVVEPPVDVAPADVALEDIRPARSISIPAPVIETWEDEEAAIAAAAIPRLEIPERVAVPMAGRHAAGGGTGWAIGLGAILLFLGVTLPAALWQQPPDEATDVVATPPSDSAPLASAPASDIPQPNAPASGALMEMTASSEPAAQAPAAPVSGAIAEQKTQHIFAPLEALRSLQDGREIAAAPINVPTAAGPAETSTAETSTGDLAAVAGVFPTATFPKAARPFIPNAGATASSTANPAHVLVAPPGAVKKPAARLKPVASAAVPPATKVAKPAAKPVAQKPVAQKPKVVKTAPQADPTVEQMFDQLIKTLSNGQPPNPATQPAPPSTRR